MSKRRLSASIDPHLLSEAEAAVKRGHAPSISAWVSLAIRRQLEHDRRMEALDGFLADFEATQGTISAAEIADASRWARSGATRVSRAPPKGRGRAAPSRHSA